jgi:hypothetical protein
LLRRARGDRDMPSLFLFAVRVVSALHLRSKKCVT